MSREHEHTQAAWRSFFGDRLAVLWVAGGLALTALIIARWGIGVSRVPADADFAAASRYLHQAHRSGDAVAVAPSWALRALASIGDLDPTFGDDLVRRPPNAARLWVLAEPEGVVTLDALAKRYPQLERKTFGKLHLAGFQLNGQRGFSLVDHIAKLKVFIDGKDGRVDCDRYGDERWNCKGKPDWQRVSAEWLDVDMSPRKVLWAHPPPAGQRLHLQAGEVRLQAELEVLAGNTIHGAQFAKAPVTVVVRIDDRDIATLSFSGYPAQSQRVDTRQYLGELHRLELQISTSDNGANHFALDAQIVPR